MIISDSYKFIFVHVQKTGGTQSFELILMSVLKTEGLWEPKHSKGIYKW